jgi:prolyl 4-hydroxylase
MQFIYSSPLALDTVFCDEIIQLFENSPLKRKGQFRFNEEVVEKPDIKKSTDISFDPSYLLNPVWSKHLEYAVQVIEDHVARYTLKFEDAMSNLDSIRLDTSFNMQRYEPGEGFYGWHCERAGLTNSNRVLAWMIYLNTVNEGGETQFYYQGHKEKAEKGKLIIWPSDWTHLHRGIPSNLENKYILTGWYTHYK